MKDEMEDDRLSENEFHNSLDKILGFLDQLMRDVRDAELSGDTERLAILDEMLKDITRKARELGLVPADPFDVKI